MFPFKSFNYAQYMGAGQSRFQILRDNGTHVFWNLFEPQLACYCLEYLQHRSHGRSFGKVNFCPYIKPLHNTISPSKAVNKKLHGPQPANIEFRITNTPKTFGRNAALAWISAQWVHWRFMLLIGTRRLQMKTLRNIRQRFKTCPTNTKHNTPWPGAATHFLQRILNASQPL